MKKNLSIIFAFIAISFLFSTCKKDDATPDVFDTPAGDSIALLDIYRIASRDPYSGLSNWNLSLPMDQWGEVTLNENRRVLSFSNHSVDINGQIPLSVKNLTKLKSLGITVNKETPFPSHIFSLTNLSYLYLTGFVGAIPKELGNFANLTSLTLQGAHTGSVPKELGNLTNLEFLFIEGTSWYGGDVPAGQFLSGSIPKELGSLTNLRWLSIAGGVTGSIPKELANLTQLQLLSLMSNQLSGTIPEEFANLTQLRSLYLSHNQLSGTIPQALLDRFGDRPNAFCPQVGTNFDNYDCNLAP